MDTSESPPPSDRDLLAEFAKRRHEAAFAEVVRRHGGMVLAVCRSVLGNTSDAEDAAQAVFLTLAQKATSPTVQARVVGWLHRVAWYVAARAAEAQTVRRRHEREAAFMRPEATPPAESDLPLDVLHAGLAGVPVKYRVPLILHHLEGRSHAETAALSGCSVEAVAVRLHRGREMLRQQMNRRGVAAPVAALAGVWVPAISSPSAMFVTGTAKAATAALSGSLASATVLSGQVLALSRGAMNMLFWAKLRTAGTMVAVTLIVSVIVGAAALSARTDNAQNPAGPPPPVAASHPVTRAITGLISQIDKRSMVLQRQNGETPTVSLDAATVVKIDGKVATAADLRVGMSAAALFAQIDVAAEVRATSPPASRPAN